MGQTVDNWGFVGQVISVTTTQVYCCNAEITLRPYFYEWAWLSFNKTLFTKTDGWSDCAHGQFICWPPLLPTHRHTFLTGECEGLARSQEWGATVTSVLWSPGHRVRAEVPSLWTVPWGLVEVVEEIGYSWRTPCSSLSRINSVLTSWFNEHFINTCSVATYAMVYCIFMVAYCIIYLTIQGPYFNQLIFNIHLSFNLSKTREKMFL